TALVPAGATSGTLTVTTAGGVAFYSPFTFVPPPGITGFTPLAQGARREVTITGTNLSGATVTFGGGPAAIVHSATGTTLIVTVPVGSATGDVSVATIGGVASASG